MRWKLLFILFCLALALPAQAQDDLLGQINGLRAQRGLPGYSINGALTAAAQQQAQWIVDNQNVSHTHPDGSGPRTRALAAGYPSIQISENIYGGTNASAGDAWTFWINSGIHYASLISPNYQEIGIGIARGSQFSAYVLVFGGAGAPPPPAGSSSGTGGVQQAAAAGPPAYIGGADEFGNIKHIVQPGDTLGDIALIYGYTWSDLQNMMQLNGLSNVRDLEVGSVFLVPPHDGTYTPAPGDAAGAPTEPAPLDAAAVVETVAPVETIDPTSQAITMIEATAVAVQSAALTAAPATITPFIAPTLPADAAQANTIATADGNIQPPAFNSTATAETVQIAAVPTEGTLRTTTATITPRTNTTTWILIALGVQMVIVVGAGIEFGRRALKRRK
ncbi:MAG: CAP domain-containing protein [Chloroflexota bacterium]